MSVKTDSNAPVGSILSRTGLKEAKDARFGGSEGIHWSVLCWRVTAVGGELEEGRAAVDVPGVGRGVIIPEVSKSRIPLAVARRAVVEGLWGPSIVV